MFKQPGFFRFLSGKIFLSAALVALLGAGTPAGFSVRAAEQQKTEEETDENEEMLDESSENLFLKEEKANVKYMPDIYRCPECGYEQDHPGSCPDHNKIELIKIISESRDPMAPPELDGNEDIIVDIPLKNLEFRKETILKTASESGKLKKESGGGK
ncbi:MAG: hypothetical protein ACQETH_00320 [Candidatus Rifleibacteriota bacterium]